MTAPHPRGPIGGEPTPGGRDPLTGYIAESLRRLEDSVTRGFDTVNLQLSKLPEQYVARREFDRYRDDASLDLTEAKRAHGVDIDEIKRDARERAAQARTLRLWLIGTASADAIAVAAIILSRH